MIKHIFPDWHNQPLSLSIHEISDSQSVIDEFYFEYSLQETRTMLWDWLVDALQYENTNAGALILFYERILKLIEAIYINKNYNKMQ